MRTINLYQIFDNEAQKTTGAIFPEHKDAPAIRAFVELFRRTNTLPGDYPEHFELLQVGTQDEETAQVTALTPPRTVATGQQWKEQQNREAKINA